jgi:hypothetical protein
MAKCNHYEAILRTMKISKKILRNINKTVKVKWKQRNRDLCDGEKVINEGNTIIGERRKVAENYSGLEKTRERAIERSYSEFEYSQGIMVYKVGEVVERFDVNQTEGKEQCWSARRRLPKNEGKFL